jgi:hypothetical protein
MLRSHSGELKRIVLLLILLIRFPELEVCFESITKPLAWRKSGINKLL